ncbi:MAG: hypothetical protein ABIJ21_05265 [Nanoarchaeota archaeon]
MDKRGGYFFVLDVFIASSIIVLTLIIIFSSRVNSPPPETSYRTAEDFMTFLSVTEFRDISNQHKLNLTRAGFVNDTALSLLQVIALLDYTGAKNTTGFPYDQIFLESIIQGILPEKYGYNYSVNGTAVLVKNPESYTGANLVLSAHRITFFRLNAQEIYGPVITEVRIWV